MQTEYLDIAVIIISAFEEGDYPSFILSFSDSKEGGAERIPSTYGVKSGSPSRWGKVGSKEELRSIFVSGPGGP
jgi:hypothetical protein